MNKLKIFENAEFGSIRTLELNCEPWFVGKDVAEILGYSNPRKALSDHVDAEDKGVTKCDTLGGKQELTTINESGLYSLILSSKLPNAKQFKRWVTSEVLPAIRKTGTYTAPKAQGTNETTAKLRAEAMLLNAQNRKAKILMQAWGAAGVEPQYQALGINDLYGGTSLPRIALKAEATALYDLTTIAKHLGVMSKSGKPHAQAVGAIVEKLKPLGDDEWAMTPYSRNGHDDQSIQYTLSVEQKVAAWLSENKYPNPIQGNGKNFGVNYIKEV